MHTREEKMQAFARLLDVMDKLRAECPWDKKQTTESLRTNTIEEVYELSDAILEGQTTELKKELGDVLLHIVFYSKIAEEEGQFDIADVCHSLCEKLVYRHPHVYPSGSDRPGSTLRGSELSPFQGQDSLQELGEEPSSEGHKQVQVNIGTSSHTQVARSLQAKTQDLSLLVQSDKPDRGLEGEVRGLGGEEQRLEHTRASRELSAEAVIKNWEQIKQTEQGGNRTVLSGVPKSLPSLIKAYRVQDKARAVGFDWQERKDVWLKVREELSELEEALEGGNVQEVEGEFGDFLFSLINTARLYKINPDDALERCTQKFIRRFTYVETEAKARGQALTELSLPQMDALWDEAKERGL